MLYSIENVTFDALDAPSDVAQESMSADDLASAQRQNMHARLAHVAEINHARKMPDVLITIRVEIDADGGRDDLDDGGWIVRSMRDALMRMAADGDPRDLLYAMAALSAVGLPF